MEKKLEVFQIRLTRGDKSRLKWLAKQYANGNLTQWLVYAGLNAPRKMLPPAKKKPAGG